MTPWILILIVPLICENLKNRVFHIGKQKFNYGYVFAFVVLFIFRAFRADTVGGDLASYKEAFDYLTELSINNLMVFSASGYETGYALYNAALHLISDNFRVELVCTAFVTTYCLLRFIYDNSRNPGLSLYIYITMYYYGSTFNNERQAIAIALLMLSIIYVRRRQLWKFVITVVAATLFHTTSIAFLVVYPVFAMTLDRKYWNLALYGAIATFILSKSILGYLIGGLYAAKYDGVDLMTGGGYMYFMILFVLIMTSFIFMSKKQKQDTTRRLWIHMLVIGAIMQILSFEMGYFYRAVILFSVSMIFYIPEVLSCMRNRSLAKFGKIVVIVLLGAYYIYELAHDSIEIVPYKSILFD